ncbi:MAG: alpha-L-arabinofuranosidase [Goleter apudmare HA4340-LM2]|jgi:xylan 1,4-beta-xylosidase|nr:alpha-L-arabinofuranosidase [Goleter apudmare HA4340-LM2]
MMQRRDVFKLGVSSAATVTLWHLIPRSQRQTISAQASTQISVDWQTSVAKSTVNVFGSNDYEITYPERARDSAYQKLLSQLNIRLVRIHQGGLSDRWSNKATKTWDISKIKAGYSASYPQKPTIVQNIPGWTEWMRQTPDGLLDPSEYDRYAAFCAELVVIINQRLGRNVQYWEPFNEKDVRYEKAGKLEELWRIYNKVAQAMKAKDPKIKIGGPVLTWDEPNRLGSFLQNCARHVDFISWHRYVTGNANESTDKIMSYTPDYGQQVREFRKITKKYLPQRYIPLYLSEYNINYTWDSGEKRQNTHIGAVWFASVLKHLAEAGVDMASSWHLKDGIYGMIDPENRLRPAATVFSWGIKYLTGTVIKTKSDRSSIEALAVRNDKGGASLLLINKSTQLQKLTFTGMSAMKLPNMLPIVYLNANGVKKDAIAKTALLGNTFNLAAYSLALVRLSGSL